MTTLDEQPLDLLETKVKTYDSAFDIRDEDSDFVICTADGAQLFVHKLILQHTSTIFATLFSLPQPTDAGFSKRLQANGDTFGREKHGLPTVAVTESKPVWDVILRLLYHRDVPQFLSPYEMGPILEAARKYELDCITNRFRDLLSCSIHTASWDPVQVYAIASMYGLTDLALQAARATLGTPLHELYTKELYDVPAYVLQRLLDFRWRCQEAAQRVTGFSRVTTGARSPLGKLYKRIDWLPRANFTFFQCECGQAAVSCSVMVGAEFEIFAARGYWKDYMERAEQAVKERPIGVAVKDPEIVISALRAADNCMVCRQQIYLDMMAFTEYLEVAVNEATSSVTLKT